MSIHLSHRVNENTAAKEHIDGKRSQGDEEYGTDPSVSNASQVYRRI